MRWLRLLLYVAIGAMAAIPTGWTLWVTLGPRVEVWAAPPVSVMRMVSMDCVDNDAIVSGELVKARDVLFEGITVTVLGRPPYRVEWRGLDQPSGTPTSRPKGWQGMRLYLPTACGQRYMVSTVHAPDHGYWKLHQQWGPFPSIWRAAVARVVTIRPSG